jgi:hypothetical protein
MLQVIELDGASRHSQGADAACFVPAFPISQLFARNGEPAAHHSASGAAAGEEFALNLYCIASPHRRYNGEAALTAVWSNSGGQLERY